MRSLFGILLFCIALGLAPARAESSVADKVRVIFDDAQQNLDLARVKFEIDRLIDPTVDVDRELARVDQMVAEVEALGWREQ